MRIVLIFLGIAVLFVAGVIYKGDPIIDTLMTKSCTAFPNTHFEKVEGKIQSSRPWEITYLFRLDYGQPDDFDFIATSLGEKPRLRYIKYLGWGRFAEDEKFPFIPTEHARDLATFKLQNKKAFAITDHGFDKPPYDGGQPLLVIKEGNTWKDQTKKRFPRLKTFNFTLTDLDLTEKGLTDIYLATVANQKGNAVLLRNNGKDHFTVSDDLPEEFKQPEFCYMTIRKLGKYQGAEYFFLGGCDRPADAAKMPRDRIMKVQNGAISLLPENSLPPRMLNSTWGTVSAVVGDLNNDGLPDVVAATHNYGYTEGGLQIYINAGEEMTFKSPKKAYHPVSEPGKNGFTPFVRLGDIDGDKYPEIIAPHIGIFKDGIDPKIQNKFALFKNFEGRKFENVTHCLNSSLFSVMSAEFLDLDQDGNLDILLVAYDGSFEIFYNRRQSKVAFKKK